MAHGIEVTPGGKVAKRFVSSYGDHCDYLLRSVFGMQWHQDPNLKVKLLAGRNSIGKYIASRSNHIWSWNKRAALTRAAGSKVYSFKYADAINIHNSNDTLEDERLIICTSGGAAYLIKVPQRLLSEL